MRKFISNLLSAFVFSAIAISSGHALAEKSESVPETTRPSDVPENYIATPFGFFHPSCVYEIKNDETLLQGLQVKKVTGEIKQIEECKFSNFLTKGVMRKKTDEATNAALDDQLQMYSVASLDGSLLYMSTNLRVPSEPEVDNGQTLYFMTGVHDNRNTSFYVVLGWNQLDYPGWTAVAWICCESGVTVYSSPIITSENYTVRVQLERQIDTLIARVLVSYGMVVLDGKQISTTNFLDPVNFIIGGAFEIFNVGSCDELPRSGYIVFDHIDVLSTEYVELTNDFEQYYIHRYCNYNIDIVNQIGNSSVRFNF